MYWDLKLIEKLRRRLGLTQHQLASLAGVSQSLVAKIERGRINPSFNSVKKIFLALEKVKAEKNEGLRAKDVCTEKVISVSVNDEIIKAVEMMRKYDISQLPVFDGERPVGSISESTMMRNLDRIRSFGVRVGDIMEEGFPIVPEETSLSLVQEILMEYPAVLLQRNGIITGIITKADILKVLESRFFERTLVDFHRSSQ